MSACGPTPETGYPRGQGGSATIDRVGDWPPGRLEPVRCRRAVHRTSSIRAHGSKAWTFRHRSVSGVNVPSSVLEHRHGTSGITGQAPAPPPPSTSHRSRTRGAVRNHPWTTSRSHVHSDRAEQYSHGCHGRHARVPDVTDTGCEQRVDERFRQQPDVRATGPSRAPSQD